MGLLSRIVPPRPRDLDALASIVRGKSVALVGNATSLFDQRHDIDRHDLVVRINKGPLVLPKDGRAGCRTDILLVSGFRGEEYLTAAPHVVWMTPKNRHKLKRWEVRRMYLYPMEWFHDLVREICAYPSTGCMGIDMLTRMIGEGSIDLYGFDWWKTPTSYTGEIDIVKHNPAAEEAFARRILAKKSPLPSAS